MIRFISDQSKETKRTKAAAMKPSEKKQKSTGILRRPIICICNDIYAPSLRSLRQIAFIVTFPQLDSTRLAERLLTIARKERLKTDLTTLLALAEKSGNDVRSCISVLQFFANSRKPLELIDVMKSNIGQKDRQKGLFEIWSAVFQIQNSTQRLDFNENKTKLNLDNANSQTTVMDNSLQTRIKNILDIVHLGDSER